MVRGKAFLVVGHKRWGKSRTLKSLTGENAHARRVSIAGHDLFVRRMSNDDHPEKFHQFVSTLDSGSPEHVILAFCPVFDQGDAEDVLRKLVERYDIFSFVIRHEFNGERKILPSEVTGLRKFGKVEIFEDRSEAPDRASALRAFVKRHCG